MGDGRFKRSEAPYAVRAYPFSLHPLDWKQFYDLVREEMPEAHPRALLRERGFPWLRLKNWPSSQFIPEFKRHRWARQVWRLSTRRSRLRPPEAQDSPASAERRQSREEIDQYDGRGE